MSYFGLIVSIVKSKLINFETPSNLGTFLKQFFFIFENKTEISTSTISSFFFVLKKSNVGTCFKTH